MKKYLLPIALLMLILAGLYYLFDESLRESIKSKASFDSIGVELDNYSTQRDNASTQIVGLNKVVRSGMTFLSLWRNYYNSLGDYETELTKIAEKNQCALVGRKWESKLINMGKLDYDTDVFNGMVVGDYRNIVKFIGEMESKLQLSVVWNLKFERSVSDVNCALRVYFPRFVFETGGAP
jgi:hypothetical protein